MQIGVDGRVGINVGPDTRGGAGMGFPVDVVHIRLG